MVTNEAIGAPRDLMHGHWHGRYVAASILGCVFDGSVRGSLGKQERPARQIVYHPLALLLVPLPRTFTTRYA